MRESTWNLSEIEGYRTKLIVGRENKIKLRIKIKNTR